jgi:radical SAM superfamily enzyme YgiQ (UPF0313 family)
MERKNILASGIEQKRYCNLYRAKSSAAFIAENIEDAKNVFRSKRDFYNANALSRARNILNQALDIISTAYFPTELDLVGFNNAMFQGSITDIKKLTQNEDGNLFAVLYEKHLIPFILKEDPDIIGISIACDSQLIPALTLSRLIKSRNKKAHIVVGGYVITLLSDTLMKYEELFTEFFDSAVLNEGEQPLLKLAEHISNGYELEGVPNLIYYDNGKVHANDILPAKDINLLPPPSFEGLPFDLYLNPEPVLPLLSSRGCYWGKCAFCSHNESYRWHYKNRDAGKVVDDMQELSQKYGAKHFAFSDEAISPNAIDKLSDEIIRRGITIRCSTNKI